MGISTPKKPFDLKAFLSEKGKPAPVRRGFASNARKAEPTEQTEPTAVTDPTES